MEFLIQKINEYKKLKIEKSSFLELKNLYNRVRYPLLTNELAPFEKIYQKDAKKCLQQAQGIFSRIKNWQKG